MKCAEDLSGLSSGEISSPFWPETYAENANCQYTLSVEEHLQLELHFSDGFDVEQSNDSQCIDALIVSIKSGHSNTLQLSFYSKKNKIKRGSSGRSVENLDLTISV